MTYEEIAEQIESLGGAQIVGYVGSKDEQYPLFMMTRGTGRKVLLSAVLHGDEPAGVYSILEFFRNHVHQFEGDFEFTAFPCLNPRGFVHCTRGNAANLNLNREFSEESEAKETQLIMPLLEKYLFAMDLHETWPNASRIGDDEPEGEDPDAFYLWEFCRDKDSRVGDLILRNIEAAGFPVCDWPKIYGDTNNKGVIWYPEDCGGGCYAGETLFDRYLERNHTKQVFTIESPRDLPLDKRILAHIISIETVLNAKK